MSATAAIHPPSLPASWEHAAVFLAEAGWREASCAPLMGDASFRRYARLTHPSHGTAMLMDAPPAKENVVPFITVQRELEAWGLSVPRLLAADAAQGLVLLEDLGDALFTPLLAALLEAAREAQEKTLYEAALETLAALQRHAPPASLPPYDMPKLLTETALFAEWYWPEIKPLRRDAWDAFQAAWENVLAPVASCRDVLVHRDFHADNLLWLPERAHVQRVGLLDFQDALAGSSAYDVVSLLEDARRDIAPANAQALLAEFTKALPASKREEFVLAYALLGAQRNAKILGIFLRLHRRDNKPRYRTYLPRVLAHFLRNMEHPALQPVAAVLTNYLGADWRQSLQHIASTPVT